ncbi:hypothetical protein ACQKKX_17100 [Neorhizobium sp. NPDC001467]|uniref:hypothetical protein n=1 Tax=Neorhizobium sp. NPDC001467 TaxID=3390595 RepID=UPI003D01A481
MTWQIVLKDGSRHEVSGDIHFESVRGSKRIYPSPIGGDSDILVRAVEQHDVVLESPHGHHYKAAVEMVDGKWRVVGL